MNYGVANNTGKGFRSENAREITAFNWFYKRTNYFQCKKISGLPDLQTW